MDPAGIPALLDAIRHLHGCEARHVATAHVHERQGAETVWEGDVEVFDLAGHPTAERAYAWSEATTGVKRRFFVVLYAPPVNSPAAAVRASLLADAREPSFIVARALHDQLMTMTGRSPRTER